VRITAVRAAWLRALIPLEFSRGENPLLHDLVQEPFDLQDGYVLASERPGLGLTLDRDFVRSITVRA
jgi:L-alanine-DL-glutamate epimerase-like enolase superfamily enzyme